MKKLLAIFAVFALAFLASCGEKATETPKEGGETVKKEEVTKNSCDQLLTYMECEYKKQGVDDATIKTTLDQTKKAWEAAGADLEATCKQAIDTAKTAGLTEGCTL